MHYATVRTGGGTRYVHRLQAATALGRDLPVGVEVHHVDSNKWNNANNTKKSCNKWTNNTNNVYRSSKTTETLYLLNWKH